MAEEFQICFFWTELFKNVHFPLNVCKFLTNSDQIRTWICTIYIYYSKKLISAELSEYLTGLSQARGLGGLQPPTPTPQFLTQWLLGLKNFLSTIDALPGVPGVSKNHIFFYKWNCFPFALTLPLKDTNFKNHQNWRKKCQKNPVFLDFFKYSSIWGQS